MKRLLSFLGIALIGLCCLITTNCQKEDTFSEDQTPDSEVRSGLKQHNTTNDVISYFLDIIGIIEVIENDGMLKKGVAKSLIVKLKNAIKSIDKGNTNAFSGQVKALINQIKALINNGMITIEQGRELLNKVESAVVLHKGSFIDARDGIEYPVVKIGDQLWMAENLRAIHLNDRSLILNEVDNVGWSNLTIAGYCWYDNDSIAYAQTYGALYNWYAVETNKLSPLGWHVPTDAEWTTLYDFLGGNIAGGKLKEAGTMHWNSPNSGATNETGFTALPGENRSINGSFGAMGSFGNWWSSTESTPEQAYYWSMYYNNRNLFRSENWKKGGFSVRCVKD